MPNKSSESLSCTMTELINREFNFFERIADLLKQARSSVVQSINRAMVYAYYEIGKLIVEEEQFGKQRAEYGRQLIDKLSTRLTKILGKAFLLPISSKCVLFT